MIGALGWIASPPAHPQLPPLAREALDMQSRYMDEAMRRSLERQCREFPKDRCGVIDIEAEVVPEPKGLLK